MMILENSRERSRFLRFALVGSIGAVIDGGVANLIIVAGILPADWAKDISFALAVTSNFLWNRYWTYPDSRSKPLSRQILQFVIVSIVGLIIRQLLFISLEPSFINLFKALALPIPFTPDFLGFNGWLVFAIVIVMLWNFFVNRFWTYSDVKHADANKASDPVKSN
jgi:putative flippase GtrA